MSVSARLGKDPLAPRSGERVGERGVARLVRPCLFGPPSCFHPENNAVYLPLKKGRNQLMLVVSELGGGWGFICRLAEVGN
jgi:hypothetical protein